MSDMKWVYVVGKVAGVLAAAPRVEWVVRDLPGLCRRGVPQLSVLKKQDVWQVLCIVKIIPHAVIMLASCSRKVR
jgi:hypothetical protein